MPKSLRRIPYIVAALATAMSPLSVTIASAQDYPPPPPGYDGSRPPPPPPGYEPDPSYAPQQAQDRRYEDYAEEWSHRNCIKSHSNAGVGAVIGGLFGAVVGSSLAGRGSHGTGALVGGVAGAAGGAAIGSSSGHETSPGCPTGC